MNSSRRLALGLVGVTFAWAARAQRPTTDAIAEALFEDGRRLMKAQRYEEACPKLAESHRLQPGGGVLLNLALCHEQEGKLATAWSEYKKALALAQRDARPSRVSFAKQHIAALGPRLNRLTIQLAPDAARDDLIITHNEVALSRAAIGTAFPVDGGRHTILASAPGFVSWSTTIEIGREGERPMVMIPALEREPTPVAPPPPVAPAPSTSVSPPPPPPPPDPTTGDSQRLAGYIVGGTGAATLIASGAFGIRALLLNRESDQKCGEGDCPDTEEGREGLRASERASASATAANVLLGVGLGLVGVGLTVVLTAPSADAAGSTATLRLDAGPHRVGSRLKLHW